MSDQITDMVKDIYTQFKKSELQAVAKELEIKLAGTENTRKLSEIILKDLEENGIPEDLTSVSDTLLELLATAEYVDEEGNLLEESDDAQAVERVAVTEVPDWMCFSYADPRDPACNRCKLYESCWVRRVELRPACFGEYSAGEPECQECIEATFCKKETNHG